MRPCLSDAVHSCAPWRITTSVPAERRSKPPKLRENRRICLDPGIRKGARFDSIVSRQTSPGGEAAKPHARVTETTHSPIALTSGVPLLSATASENPSRGGDYGAEKESNPKSGVGKVLAESHAGHRDVQSFHTCPRRDRILGVDRSVF